MKNLYTILLVLFVSLNVYSQQDLLMFNQLDIPQSSFSNPANQFNGKGFLGLPFISSNYYSISNSGFAYSDFIKKDGDSLQLDFNSLLNELNEEDYLAFQAKIDLLSFGFKIGKRTQITANITENIGLKFSYTKDFISFIDKGNLGFDDNTANFDKLGIQASYYREFGLGISHQFGTKLQLGARFKYLYGIANFDSKKIDLALSTDPTTYAITANADIEFNTSGNLDINDPGESASETFLGNNNTGYAIDFGANYELSKKLNLSASVLDLGFIEWKSNVNNYIIEDGEYIFNGLAIDAFAPQGDTGASVFGRIEDSLKQSFNLQETQNSYTSNLAGRIYAGAHYKYNEKLQVGALLQSEFFKNTINPSVTINANYKLLKWITIASSWTYINGSYNNIGFGLNLNPGPIQIYLVSDNILSGFRPQHARHAQFRVGINLIFGSKKTHSIHPSFDGVTASKKSKEKETEE